METDQPMNAKRKMSRTSGLKTEGAAPRIRRAASSGFTRSPDECILHLHRTVGNQAVKRLLRRSGAESAIGDIYEQEADRVAEQVMRMSDPTLQPV